MDRIKELAIVWDKAIYATDKAAERRLNRRTPERDKLVSDAYREELEAREAYLKAGGPLPVPVHKKTRTRKSDNLRPSAQIVTSHPDANLGHPRKGLTINEYWAKKGRNDLIQNK